MDQVEPVLRRRFGLQRNGQAIQRVWYVHDGAPWYLAIVVRNRLAELFPNRVVGMVYGVDWPARSPDLTPLDFFYGDI